MIRAELVTGAEDTALFFENLEVEEDSVSCYVTVRSEGFVARRPFYFSRLSRVLAELESLNQTLSGKVNFAEGNGRDAIRLECNRFGHVIVTGELYLDQGNYHEFQFCFVTDQTCLAPFLHELQGLKREQTDEFLG